MSTLPPLRLEPHWTRVDPSAFVASGATVVGDVHLGPEASVWFGAVLRGDTDAIRIGARTNIQDGAVVHVDPGVPVHVGEGVTIGHQAVVHGATLEDGCLIGMGAIVSNGVTVGAGCLVGAGALLTPGKTFPAGHLVIGAPAKAVRPLTAEEALDLVDSATSYAAKAEAFKAAGHHDPRHA